MGKGVVCASGGGVTLLPGGGRFLRSGVGVLQGGVARGLGGRGVCSVLVGGGWRDGSGHGAAKEARS